MEAKPVKENLITEILQVCKVNAISNGTFFDMETIFIQLSCASESALIKIASELHIKIPISK